MTHDPAVAQVRYQSGSMGGFVVFSCFGFYPVAGASALFLARRATTHWYNRHERVFALHASFQRAPLSVFGARKTGCDLYCQL